MNNDYIDDDKRMYHSQSHFNSMAVWRCNTAGISQCSMSRASTEATGHHHWATTHSVLPRRLPGQQQTKQWWKCTNFAGHFWPWRWAGTIPCTLPDGGSSCFSKKPLNATIGQELAPIEIIGHFNAVNLLLFWGGCCWRWHDIDIASFKGCSFLSDRNKTRKN